MSAASRKQLAAVPPDGEAGKPPAADQDRAHGPYGRPPRSPALLPGERQPMLAEVLDGVRLGAYDRRTVDWLCRWLDTPTFLSLLGILERARLAEPPATPAPHARGGSQR